MIQGMFVIDAHCHIYPSKIASRAVAGTDAFYGTVARGSGTVEDLLAQGLAAGTDHFVVQSVATTPKQVRSINTFIATCVREGKGMLTGLGTMHPECEDIPGEISYLKELGLKGIKIHPDIQAVPLDHPGFMKMYECCEREGLPVLMHTGDYRYDYSNPNRLLPVLKAFPGMTVVGAHFAGWSIWDRITEDLVQCPNLYVDCSSTLPFLNDPDPAFAAMLIRRHGADRVLYGTDYPMWAPKEEMQRFLSVELTPEERKKIFSENAAKVYGISDSVFSSARV